MVYHPLKVTFSEIITIICAVKPEKPSLAWNIGGSGFSVSSLQITLGMLFGSLFDIEHHYYLLWTIYICLQSFYMIFKCCFKMCFLHFVCLLCFVRNDEIKLWNQINQIIYYKVYEVLNMVILRRIKTAASTVVILKLIANYELYHNLFTNQVQYLNWTLKVN